MTLITTKEAAARLGVIPARARALIAAKRLPAMKVGRDWLIEEKDLELVRDRKPGRPPNTQTSTTSAKKP